MKQNNFRNLMLIMLACVSIGAWAIKAKSDGEGIAKIGETVYSTLADAVAAAETDNEVVIIKEGTYTVPNLPKNITVKANERVNVTFNCVGSGSIASIPNGATFEGVTFDMGQSQYHGFQHAGTINMNECTLNGLFFSYGDMNFNGCTFEQENKEYMMWDYGQDLTYTNCVFNGHGKFINVYNEGNGNWKLTVIGCTFKNDGDANKAPINIKETCGATLLGWDVTIGEGNVLEGNFPANSTSAEVAPFVGGGGLWQVDDRCKDHTKSLVVVKDSKGNILYEATNANAATEQIKVDYNLEITPNEGDSELTGDQKTVATATIQTLASNTEATTLPEDTKESNTAAVNEKILTEGQSVIVDVVIKSATVEAADNDGITIKKVTFDVTPYVTKGDVAKDKIDNENINQPITFRLPVSETNTYNCAEVFHEGTSIGVKTITTGTNGNGNYLEISSKEFSEFSYVLMSAPTSIEYYAGNLTKQTGTIDNFVTAKTTCPNAIAIVSSIYNEIAETVPNVIVEYDNNSVKSYVCPNFVLTDLKDFYTPVAFTAKAGSYSRNNTAGKNSVCLPFAIDKEMLDAEKIGTFVSANLTGEGKERKGTLSFKDNDGVEAGTPCIVECSNEVTSWNIQFDNTPIVAQPNNANALRGTFISEKIGVNYFKVASDGTKFVNSTEGSDNFPFRACVDLTSDSSLGFATKALNFVWEEDNEDEGATTGISNVNAENASDAAYDLYGRKAEKLVRGSIYIINGKKTIIR